MTHPIIIIGAGLAGWTTAREFRKLDASTPVLLITADSGTVLFFSTATSFAAAALGSDPLGLGARLEQLQTGGNARLCLQFNDARIALNAIAASRVAAKFGFVPQPSPAAGEDACT